MNSDEEMKMPEAPPEVEEIENYSVKAGDVFTAPEAGLYLINGRQRRLALGEMFIVKPCAPWVVGTTFRLRTQDFKTIEIGERAVFLKRIGPKPGDPLKPGDPRPTTFFTGETVSLGAMKFVMVQYFAAKDVYSFMPFAQWWELKEQQRGKN